MDALEKQIIGKWVDIKDKERDIHAINEYFHLPAATLKLESEKLNASVELGIIEYKRNIINSIFRALGNVKYKSLSQEMISKLAQIADSLLYIILLQKLIITGLVRNEKDKAGNKISADSIEINLILQDIMQRIKENPEFTKKNTVKNILIQFTIYKNERDTLKKLSPNIKEKSDIFYQNFKIIFEKIFASIRKNYAEILNEELEQSPKPNILNELQDKKMTTILLNQAKEVSKIQATIEFAYNERYKTRELLVNLYNARNTIVEAVELEFKYYKEFNTARGGNANATTSLCNTIARELATLIAKYI